RSASSTSRGTWSARSHGKRPRPTKWPRRRSRGTSTPNATCRWRAASTSTASTWTGWGVRPTVSPSSSSRSGSTTSDEGADRNDTTFDTFQRTEGPIHEMARGTFGSTGGASRAGFPRERRRARPRRHRGGAGTQDPGGGGLGGHRRLRRRARERPGQHVLQSRLSGGGRREPGARLLQQLSRGLQGELRRGLDEARQRGKPRVFRQGAERGRHHRDHGGGARGNG